MQGSWPIFNSETPQPSNLDSCGGITRTTPKHQQQLTLSPHISYFRLFPLVCRLICGVSSGHRAHNSEDITVSREQSTQFVLIKLEANWLNPRRTPKIDTAVDRTAQLEGVEFWIVYSSSGKNIVCKEVEFFGSSIFFSFSLILPSKDPGPKRMKSFVEWYIYSMIPRERSLVPRRKQGTHHGSANRSGMFDHLTTHWWVNIGQSPEVTTTLQPADQIIQISLN